MAVILVCSNRLILDLEVRDFGLMISISFSRLRILILREILFWMELTKPSCNLLFLTRAITGTGALLHSSGYCSMMMMMFVVDDDDDYIATTLRDQKIG